jgi:hypothetical protein
VLQKRSGLWCGGVSVHVQRGVEKALAAVPGGDARLRMFSAVWTAHRLVTEWLVRMFSPVDCGDPHNKDKMTLVEFKRVVSLTSWAYREFKAVVFTTAKEGLVQSVHDVMNRDREGAVVDRSVVKNAIDMFLVMGACDKDDVQNLRNDVDVRRRVRWLCATHAVLRCLSTCSVGFGVCACEWVQVLHVNMTVDEAFVIAFQQPLVEHVCAYYRPIANFAADRLDVASFLHVAKKHCDEEEARCRLLVPVVTQRAVLNSVRTQFLENHVAFIVNREGSGLMAMLQDLYQNHAAAGDGALGDKVFLLALNYVRTEHGLPKDLGTVCNVHVHVHVHVRVRCRPQRWHSCLLCFRDAPRRTYIQ